MYREKSLWDSSDSDWPNRLLELTIWRYNGKRCPYSGIDADGFGQKYLWPEHGNTPLHIDFYYNHVHSSTLFLKDDGRFDEGWIGNYPKRFYYLELLGWALWINFLFLRVKLIDFRGLIYFILFMGLNVIGLWNSFPFFLEQAV